jgi:small-conductance mechanosensitive channel
MLIYACRKIFCLLFILVLISSAPAQEIPSGTTINGDSEQAETVEESPVTGNTAEETDIDKTPEIKTDVETIQTLEEIAETEAHTLSFTARLGIALAIIFGQVLLIWLIWHLFKVLSKKVNQSAGDKIKPLTIKKFKLLTARQIIEVIQFFLRILKYLVTAFQLFLTLPIVFWLFPQTRDLANTLFGYILTPLKNIAIGTIKYIPNLITIIIIIIIARYVLKVLKFFATQIKNGKLVIPGFYEDWAAPTYRILQVLLIAFTVALVYPYLPGSDSKVFQGVSVFVGIIFSLGSSSAIGNLVAGLVITYMRPFKIGDRVKINESTGFIIEKTLMVVRLKTHKNEYVTFPNLMILNSGIINYNTSSDEDEEGLILNTEITIGYATSWQIVEELLINAALATDYVQKTPKPFVLQVGLDDFYARYQINCYTKEVQRIPAIYAQLFEKIQSGFREAGLDLTSPHFEISIPGQRK